MDKPTSQQRSIYIFAFLYFLNSSEKAKVSLCSYSLLTTLSHVTLINHSSTSLMCIQFLNRSLILERGSEYMIHFPHFSDYKKISRSNI